MSVIIRSSQQIIVLAELNLCYRLFRIVIGWLECSLHLFFVQIPNLDNPITKTSRQILVRLSEIQTHHWYSLYSLNGTSFTYFEFASKCVIAAPLALVYSTIFPSSPPEATNKFL